MALPVANAYFVWHGIRDYLSVTSAKPILLALLAVEVTVWLLGIFMAVFALAYVSNPRPVTLGGWIFGLAFLAVSLLPGFIHLQVRRIERGD